MKKILLMFLMLPLLMFGQQEFYNLKFTNTGCDTTCIDIEISSEDEFYLSDGNIRASFNRVVDTLPNGDYDYWIEREYEPSGFVNHTTAYSFYGPHTLNGSIDTVISYNFPLEGGRGVKVDSFVKIGQLCFNMVNNYDCFTPRIHTTKPEDFPPTFIGFKENQILYEATASSFDTDTSCYLDCSVLPLELVEFTTKPYGYSNSIRGVFSGENELGNPIYLYRGLNRELIGTFFESFNYIDKEAECETYYSISHQEIQAYNHTYNLNICERDLKVYYNGEINIEGDYSHYVIYNNLGQQVEQLNLGVYAIKVYFDDEYFLTTKFFVSF